MQFWPPILAFAENAAEVEKTNDVLGEVIDLVQNRGIELGLHLIEALVIFIIGRLVAKLLRGAFTSVMLRAKVDETLAKFLANILFALLITFVILMALNRLGVDTTSVTAVIAAAGLAVGFALQGSLSNFASGVMLILYRPFKAGDFVEVGGTSGVVEEIMIFHTMLRTHANIQIIVPNSSITSATITNYSAKDTRRIDLVFGCGYGDDLRAVRQFLEETIAADERILADPEPTIAVDELGDSSVNFVVRPWVKSSDYGKVRWDLIEKVKLGFDERGFTIPYPTQDIHVHQSAGE